METIQQYIRNNLTPCLYCGSLFKARPLLCSSCYSEIDRYRCDDLHEFGDDLYPMYSLYDWTADQSNILSRFFLAVKGNKDQIFWREMAREFLRQRSLSDTIDLEPVIFVPAPSSSGRPDHAYHWAVALSYVAGGDFLPCLYKKRKLHQRGKNREQRKKIHVELIEKYSDLSESSTEGLWIFVDDVVTTGATASAAYEALGSPPRFEVWALGRRSLSCGAPRTLL